MIHSTRRFLPGKKAFHYFLPQMVSFVRFVLKCLLLSNQFLLPLSVKFLSQFDGPYFYNPFKIVPAMRFDLRTVLPSMSLLKVTLINECFCFYRLRLKRGTVYWPLHEKNEDRGLLSQFKSVIPITYLLFSGSSFPGFSFLVPIAFLDSLVLWSSCPLI